MAIVLMYMIHFLLYSNNITVKVSILFSVSYSFNVIVYKMMVNIACIV